MAKLDSLLSGGLDVTPATDQETQAAHAAAPQVSTENTAGTIVLALTGFMVLYYVLHVAERWAEKA